VLGDSHGNVVYLNERDARSNAVTKK